MSEPKNNFKKCVQTQNLSYNSSIKTNIKAATKLSFRINRIHLTRIEIVNTRNISKHNTNWQERQCSFVRTENMHFDTSTMTLSDEGWDD